jgi:hypothetical protein
MQKLNLSLISVSYFCIFCRLPFGGLQCKNEVFSWGGVKLSPLGTLATILAVVQAPDDG